LGIWTGCIAGTGGIIVGSLVRSGRGSRGLMMKKSVGMSDADWLFQTRSVMKVEAKRILDCSNENDRKLLAWEWKQKYSTTFVSELMGLLKKKREAIKIANWDLKQFESERLRNK
jgi:hypothetical protein